MTVSSLSNLANVDVSSFKDTTNNTDTITNVATTTLSSEEYVKRYFSDTPILAEVAKCESQFRQYDKYGGVLRGDDNVYDIGIMQINELYHRQLAKKLGLDINNISGNVAYARDLFEREGLRPWIASSKCWSKTQAYRNYKMSDSLAMK